MLKALISFFQEGSQAGENSGLLLLLDAEVYDYGITLRYVSSRLLIIHRISSGNSIFWTWQLTTVNTPELGETSRERLIFASFNI